MNETVMSDHGSSKVGMWFEIYVILSGGCTSLRWSQSCGKIWENIFLQCQIL